MHLERDSAQLSDEATRKKNRKSVITPLWNPALITWILQQSEPFLFVRRVERWQTVSEKCERIQPEQQTPCVLKLTRSDSSLQEWYISALPDCVVQPGWEKTSAAAHLLQARRNSYQPDSFAPTNLLVRAPQGKQLCGESWSSEAKS